MYILSIYYTVPYSTATILIQAPFHASSGTSAATKLAKSRASSIDPSIHYKPQQRNATQCFQSRSTRSKLRTLPHPAVVRNRNELTH